MKKNNLLLVLLLYIFFVIGCSDDSNPVDPPADKNPDTEEPSSVWDSFVKPELSFVNADSLGNGKYYTLYFDDPVNQIDTLILLVNKILYKDPSEVIDIAKIELRIEEYEGGVAYTTGLGAANKKRIVFSSDYLSKIMQGKTKREVQDEINGVLIHEMTHVFQQACEYKNDGWSCIEGIADALRYLSGADKITRRHSGGSYTDGYTTTGFFIVWLMENKDSEFLYKLNQYAGKNYDFKWSSAAYSLLDDSIENLWTEYQDAL
ncbi:MAG: hypothetical protein JEY94_05940 [Melioribacteraceae bacterium]|nr:hypothetical protein [Melioribacteraceae bacterium]